MCLTERDQCRAEYVSRRHISALGGGGTAGQEAKYAFPSLSILPSINALVNNILLCPQEPLINSHPTVTV